MSFDRCFHTSIGAFRSCNNKKIKLLMRLYLCIPSRYYQLSLSISIFYICKSTFFRNPFFSSIFDSPACAMQFEWKWSVKKIWEILIEMNIAFDTTRKSSNLHWNNSNTFSWYILTNKYSYFACRTYQRHGRYVCEPTLWK